MRERADSHATPIKVPAVMEVVGSFSGTAILSVQITFLESGRGVEILAGGIVRGDEIVEVNKAIYGKRNLALMRYQIVDKSSCTEYALTADHIEAIAELDKAASLINPNIVIAIVESIRLQFSLTELWQAHLKDCPFKTKSFRDRKSANQWILENAE